MSNVPVPATSIVPDLTPACKVMSSEDASDNDLLSVAHREHRDGGDDSICVAADITDTIHFYHYHIVYLPSYSVPTLLFNGQHEDGSLLEWDSIVADLPESYQDVAQRPDAKWTFISQTDHPHLKSPWYMLHPCQTAELLQIMLQPENPDVDEALGPEVSLQAEGLQYMRAWFSLVGPVIHMQLASPNHLGS